MGIKNDYRAMRQRLDQAVRDASNSNAGSPLWRDRVRWLEPFVQNETGKTYVPALGAALLAKAIDPHVDVLTQQVDAGPGGYYMRGVAEFMQKQLRGRVHLGTLSKNPVNNSPFLRGPARIDRFTAVDAASRPAFDNYLGWLVELNAYDANDAFDALVSWVQVRRQAQLAADAAAAAAPQMGAAKSLRDLLDVLHLWLTEKPEKGARGQAAVAGALSCVYDDIEVVPKFHPAPFDVKRAGTPTALACEVKQQVVTQPEVLDLAGRAAKATCTLAVYAMLDPRQPLLQYDSLRRDALDRYGVLLDVYSDIAELVTSVGVAGGASAASIAAVLPQLVMRYAPDAQVSQAGQDRLASLLGGVTGAQASIAALGTSGRQSRLLP